MLSELFSQFPESPGSGADAGWESTQKVSRNTFAGTAGGTYIIKSAVFSTAASDPSDCPHLLLN